MCRLKGGDTASYEDRNDGTDVLEATSTFIVPAGSPLHVPADNVPAAVLCGGRPPGEVPPVYP